VLKLARRFSHSIYSPTNQNLGESKFGAKGRGEESLESLRAVGVVSELLGISP
jgi:hypothetical protein